MKSVIRMLVVIVFLLSQSVQIIFAQDTTSIELVADFQDWGWEAWVMQNDLITIATVPVIGARIMQYQLGPHNSVYTNPDEYGKTYTPTSNSPWHNFGGYKTWPAPQERWGWPPPPILDFGEYDAEAIPYSTRDSISLVVSSPIEKWQAPDLRFQRKLTIYKGTSRVKVEQTIINEGASAAEWSVWDVTQSIANHDGLNDSENFWVYFPINPESVFGEGGVRFDNASSAWRGEVAPGIYGVQYLPEGKKIFADPHEGWVCYVDERDGFTYAKTFAIYEDAQYPDNGARVEVWINGGGERYLEVEVLSPVVELPANGGSYTFTEDWWATKLFGPVLNVNAAGATAKYLERNLDSGAFLAEYGVFHKGTASVVFYDDAGAELGRGTQHDVSPLATFSLNENIQIPARTKTVEVQLLNEEGALAGILEKRNIGDITSVESLSDLTPGTFRLLQNYPNPFNPSTKIGYILASTGEVSLAVYNLKGELILDLVNEVQASASYEVEWNGKDESGRIVASGMYLFKITVRSKEVVYTESKKMVLLR